MRPSLPAHAGRVALALGTLYVVWGATYLAIRVAVAHLPFAWLCAARYVVAAALLLGLAAALRQPRPTAREAGWAGVMGLFTVFGMNGLVVYAEQTISSGLAALLVASLPFWLVGLERLAGTPVSRRAAAGCALGVAGVAGVSAPGLTGGVDVVAVGLVLLAALLNAGGLVLARRVPMPASGLYMSAWAQGAAAVAFVATTAGLGERVAWAQVPAAAWWALAFLTVFGSVVGYSAYFWLSKAAPPEVVSTYAFVNPLVAVLLGAALLGEPLDAATVAGGAAILAAVVLVTRPRRSGRPRTSGARRWSACPARLGAEAP